MARRQPNIIRAKINDLQQKNTETVLEFSKRAQQILIEYEQYHGAISQTHKSEIEDRIREKFENGLTNKAVREAVIARANNSLKETITVAIRLQTRQDQLPQLNEIICNYCEKRGHKEAECRLKQKRVQQSNEATSSGVTSYCFKCSTPGHSDRACLVARTSSNSNRETNNRFNSGIRRNDNEGRYNNNNAYNRNNNSANANQPRYNNNNDRNNQGFNSNIRDNFRYNRGNYNNSNYGNSNYNNSNYSNSNNASNTQRNNGNYNTNRDSQNYQSSNRSGGSYGQRNDNRYSGINNNNSTNNNNNNSNSSTWSRNNPNNANTQQRSAFGAFATPATIPLTTSQFNQAPLIATQFMPNPFIPMFPNVPLVNTQFNQNSGSPVAMQNSNTQAEN